MAQIPLDSTLGQGLTSLPPSDFTDSRQVELATGLGPSAPRIAWRRRVLLLAAIIGCLTVFLLARKRIIRVIGLCYSFWTVFVVVSTANHFVLDAAAGWACIGISVAMVTRHCAPESRPPRR